MNRPLRATLPPVAIALFVGLTILILMTAGQTLGYDYQAYVEAARRVLDGRPLYDSAVDVAGGFAIFLYPPPFVFAVLPFAVVPESVGLIGWEALLVGAMVVGIALLPVRPLVRWAVLLLAALDWPVLFAFKLGQVGPVLFLLFVIGWRWRDRPGLLGLSIAAGSLVKVQPVMLVAWAALTGRRRAAAMAVGAIAVAAFVAALVLGPDVWADYVALLGRVSSPVITPHNFTPGAIAYQAGVPEAAATAIQLASLLVVGVAVVVALGVAGDEVSYITTVVASQMLSPLLWDHYAVVLLLPVAWLLQRGHWWAVAIPLVTALPLVGTVPAAVYPVVFAIGLLGPLVVDIASRPGPVAPGPAGVFTDPA